QIEIFSSPFSTRHLLTHYTTSALSPLDSTTPEAPPTFPSARTENGQLPQNTYYNSATAFF
ncbi:hypothetical protein ACFLR7_07355, partial [Acidobacteriota bacterium]